MLRSAKPCSLSRFFKNRQTFFAFHIFLFAPRNLRCKTLKLFQRSLRLCTVFCNPVNFEESFFSTNYQQPPLPRQPPKHYLSVISRAHEYTSRFRVNATLGEILFLILSTAYACRHGQRPHSPTCYLYAGKRSRTPGIEIDTRMKKPPEGGFSISSVNSA